MKRSISPAFWLLMLGMGLSACSTTGERLYVTAKEPGEPLKGDLVGAILGDLNLDGEVGNGGPGTLLALAEAEVELRSLRCRSAKLRQFCTFDLLVKSDVKQVLDMNVPEALRCTARLTYVDEGWRVDHTPPPKRRGHTRTTIRCEDLIFGKGKDDA